jgi:hypothetical protein
VKVNVFVDIVVGNVMIWGPTEWTKQASHTGRKLLVTALSHALQHGHLLIFDPTINLKMVEILSAHWHSVGINLTGTTTRQDCTHNAHAKYDDGTMHDWFHSLRVFLKDDVVRGPVIPTS